MRALSLVALLLVASVAQADVILGLTNQGGLGSSLPISSFYVSFNFGVGWFFEVNAADVGHVFVASADTVGQYPVMDWDYLQRAMIGESPFVNFLCARGGCGGFSTAEMHQLNSFNWKSYLTEPDIFFKTLDRIEFELVSLAPGKVNDINNAMIQWRFYGEPTSTPEPSCMLLMLMGLVAAATIRRR